MSVYYGNIYIDSMLREAEGKTELPDYGDDNSIFSLKMLTKINDLV